MLCSPWMAMRVLGMEFGYKIPVMPIGGNFFSMLLHTLLENLTDDAIA